MTAAAQFYLVLKLQGTKVFYKVKEWRHLTKLRNEGINLLTAKDTSVRITIVLFWWHIIVFVTVLRFNNKVLKLFLRLSCFESSFGDHRKWIQSFLILTLFATTVIFLASQRRIPTLQKQLLCTLFIHLDTTLTYYRGQNCWGRKQSRKNHH